jgi:hypothetical protein
VRLQLNLLSDLDLFSIILGLLFLYPVTLVLFVGKWLRTSARIRWLARELEQYSLQHYGTTHGGKFFFDGWKEKDPDCNFPWSHP